jgi:hypothetical protein
MAIKHFIRFAVLFLAASSCFAQQFTASTNVEDPPYGMVAQVWNNTTSTIYVDHIDVSGVLEASGQIAPNGIVEFGIGFSHLEENQCKPAVSTLFIDPVNGPYPSTDANLRVTQQPCTPGGLVYGIPLGPNKWNYTPTNLYVLSICYGTICSIDLSNLAVPPGRGVTVYTSYYVGPYAYGWKGYVGVNFRGHR